VIEKGGREGPSPTIRPLGKERKESKYCNCLVRRKRNMSLGGEKRPNFAEGRGRGKRPPS